MNTQDTSFTEATTGYWQDIVTAVPPRFPTKPPYRFGYPVALPDGRFLVLPLRRLPDSDHAVASLIVNQASHSVTAALAAHMANQVQALQADILVGLPTLGLTLASLVANALGHTRYVPFGYSRKFWYDDALSVPVASITSPESGKRLRLDPNLLPLIEGKRVVLIDDAISTGATAVAAANLLAQLNVELAGMVVAMKQTTRWQTALQSLALTLPVLGVYGCPLFRRGDDGWWPMPETQPEMP
jgi:adenine/guanine phosphoribosyltransferase-like PRPP-binding protein